MTINTNATVSYGDVTFENIVKSKVTSRPVFNEQKTAAKYTDVTIEVEAIVKPRDYTEDPATTTNQSLDFLRRRLTQQGLRLRYEDKGFGNFDSNNSSSFADRQAVDYGPRPNLFVFETIADGEAARIVWSVTVRLNENCLAFKGLSEFWVTSSISINRSGYQTLTRTGYIEIMGNQPQNQSEKISRSFKTFISNIQSNTGMEGYHLDQNFSFTNDDRGCNFTLTYTEIESPNAYPMGVVDINFSQKAASSLASKNKFKAQFRTWTNNLSGSITLRPGTPKINAWIIFITLATQRINFAIVNQQKNKNGGNINKVLVPFILDISVEDEIYSDMASFNITWANGGTSISDAFTRTGIFQPVNNSWNQWTADIRSAVQNVDGALSIINPGNTSIIVNPCNQSIPTDTPSNAAHTNNPISVALFETPCPPPEASWIDYQNVFRIQSQGNTVTHVRYGAGTGRGTYSGQIDTSFGIDNQYRQGVAPARYIRQDFGADNHKIIMRGFAIRLGRPTSPPEVQQIGGRPVRINEDESMIENRQQSSFSDCPVFVTTWHKVYEILGNPFGNLETGRTSTGENADR